MVQTTMRKRFSPEQSRIIPPPRPRAFLRRLEALGRGQRGSVCYPAMSPSPPGGVVSCGWTVHFPGDQRHHPRQEPKRGYSRGGSTPSKAPLLRYETPFPFARLILIRWRLDLHHFPVCLTKKIHR